MLFSVTILLFDRSLSLLLVGVLFDSAFSDVENLQRTEIHKRQRSGYCTSSLILSTSGWNIEVSQHFSLMYKLAPFYCEVSEDPGEANTSRAKIPYSMKCDAPVDKVKRIKLQISHRDPTPPLQPFK